MVVFSIPRGVSICSNVARRKYWLVSFAWVRLKRKKQSNDQVDPGLNKGYAYFVEDTKYKEFLDCFSETLPHEQSTCHNHDAMKLANMKKFHKTDASGVVTAYSSEKGA